MRRIQFGFCMPADRLDTARQPTFVDDLNRALDLISGHFDSAWFIDHLQSGDAGLLEGFTALTYMAALHPQLTFGHTVLCQSFRKPALLAKMGATLHFLRGVRARLRRDWPRPRNTAAHVGRWVCLRADTSRSGGHRRRPL